MLIAHTTILNCTPERAWAEVQTTRLLAYVAHPLVRFVPVDPPALPAVWNEGRYLVALRLFGWLPFGTQWIVTSILLADATSEQEYYVLRDNGHSDLIATWDHLICMRATADGRTHYTDLVEVRAGLLTPLIWLYATIFYRHRQARWRRLVAHDFDYHR
jgi:hypothetical protein